MTYVQINTKTTQGKKFLELIETMPFAKVLTEGPGLKKLTLREKKFLRGLDESVLEVNLHKKGKGKLKTLQQVLNGL